MSLGPGRPSRRRLCITRTAQRHEPLAQLPFTVESPATEQGWIVTAMGWPVNDDEYDAWLNDPIRENADPYNPYFDRLGHQLPDVQAWAALLGRPGYKRVALTSVGPFHVSTVWLGLDMGWAEDGGPIIFETMTFVRRRRDRHKVWARNELCERYATEREALIGHERIVNRIRARGAAVVWSHRKDREWKEALRYLHRAGVSPLT